MEWRLTLRQAVDTGLVYPKVDDSRGSFWAPGKMVKKGMGTAIDIADYFTSLEGV